MASAAKDAATAKDAIIEFQKALGLSATGTLTDETQNALNAVLKKYQVAPPANGFTEESFNPSKAATENKAVLDALSKALREEKDERDEQYIQERIQESTDRLHQALENEGISDKGERTEIIDAVRGFVTSGLSDKDALKKILKKPHPTYSDGFLLDFLVDEVINTRHALSEWRAKGGSMHDSHFTDALIAAMALSGGRRSKHDMFFDHSEHHVLDKEVYKDAFKAEKSFWTDPQSRAYLRARASDAEQKIKEKLGGIKDEIGYFDTDCSSDESSEGGPINNLAYAIFTEKYVPTPEDIQIVEYAAGFPEIDDILKHSDGGTGHNPDMVRALAYGLRDNLDLIGNDPILRGFFGIEKNSDLEDLTAEDIEAKLRELQTNPDLLTYELKFSLNKALGFQDGKHVTASSSIWLPLIDQWRAHRAIDTFGSVMDLKRPMNVRAVEFGEDGFAKRDAAGDVRYTEQELTGPQLMMQYMVSQMTHGGRSFHNQYGVTYKEAMAKATWKSDSENGFDSLPPELRADLERWGEHVSVIDMINSFKYGQDGIGPDFTRDHKARFTRYADPKIGPPEQTAYWATGAEELKATVTEVPVTEQKTVHAEEEVKAIQGSLNHLREQLDLIIDTGLTVDGMMGRKTSNALEELMMRAQYVSAGIKLEQLNSDYNDQNIGFLTGYLSTTLGYSQEEIDALIDPIKEMQRMQDPDGTGKSIWDISYHQGEVTMVLVEGELKCIPVSSLVSANLGTHVDMPPAGEYSQTQLSLAQTASIS